MSVHDFWKKEFSAYGVSIGYIFVGAMIAFVIAYLTPLHNVNIIEPTVARVKPAVFYEAFEKNPEKYLLIDIRSIEVRSIEYPEHSVYIPLNILVGEINALPRDKNIVVFCESNFSAMAAYFVLQDNGFRHIAIVEGGRAAWKEAGLPMVQGSDEQKRIAGEIMILKSSLDSIKI